MSEEQFVTIIAFIFMAEIVILVLIYTHFAKLLNEHKKSVKESMGVHRDSIRKMLERYQVYTGGVNFAKRNTEKDEASG